MWKNDEILMNGDNEKRIVLHKGEKHKLTMQQI